MKLTQKSIGTKFLKSLRDTDSYKNAIKSSYIVDGGTWSNCFTTLSKIPEKHIKYRIITNETKINELLNSKTVNYLNKLDLRITALEIEKTISSLKSGKSIHNISNNDKLIKTSQIVVHPCILKLFNILLTLGIYPEKLL